MVDADIEDVMQHFSHTTSDKEVMPENYFKDLLAQKMEEGTRCWKGYKKKGTKKMFGKTVPNCVKNEDVDIDSLPDVGSNFPVQKQDIENIQSVIDKRTPDIVPFDNKALVNTAKTKFPDATPGMQKNCEVISSMVAKKYGLQNPKPIIVMHEKRSGIGMCYHDYNGAGSYPQKGRGQVTINWKANIIDRVEYKHFDEKGNRKEINVTGSMNGKDIHTLTEDVVGMNTDAKKPYFTPKEADQANYEWINQAQVDQEDGVIIKGTDGNQYRIMTSYGNQHFEDGEVYLDGVTDPEYLDTDGYPDAAELLYYHSATGHYPDDEEYEVEENFKDGKVKGKSRPGRVKKAGASCNGSVTSLRKKAKNSSGEKSKMYHWCANMKAGRKKSK